jgi:predicted neuraminidase/peroxiredoxin
MRLALASLSCNREPLAASCLRWLLGLLVLFAGLIRLSHALEFGERVGPVELITLDGRPLTMTNYAARRGTVVVFLSARGGAAKEETHTLGELSARLRLRGALFVGIFPNARETSAETRRFAQSQGLLFPIYRDPEGKATKRFGASVTPEVFLLDADGTLVYRGAIGGANELALASALSALLDGRPVEPKQVPAKGTPIGQAAPKLSAEDPFGSVAFSSELIFETIPDVPAHHCSTIAEAANGDLLVVWYGGSYESADDQSLFLSRRKQGERAWSKPEVLIRDSIQPPGNAVVFRAGGKRMFIVWCRMEASRPLRRGGGWGQTRLFFRTSRDHGQSWSKDQPFLGGLPEGLRNLPITLGSGELLLPLGHSFAGSGNGGQTWEHLGSVDSGGQPTVIQRSDGSLLTLLRKSPRILQAESRDAGRTWSKPIATDLKNPDAGIALTQLRNGHLVLVFNDSVAARTPLSIARSLDEGRTWLPPLALESNPGEYSYPCVMQASNGRIHITYTFRRYTVKHVELDENWLTHLSRPN